MIRDIADALTGAISAAGIASTADARNVIAPGAFVTVTGIGEPSLDYRQWRARGEVIIMARDLGGLADLDSLSELLETVLDALTGAGIEITDISTAEQATPPSGGKLPAIRITYKATVERE